MTSSYRWLIESKLQITCLFIPFLEDQKLWYYVFWSRVYYWLKKFSLLTRDILSNRRKRIVWHTINSNLKVLNSVPLFLLFSFLNTWAWPSFCKSFLLVCLSLLRRRINWFWIGKEPCIVKLTQKLHNFPLTKYNKVCHLMY